MAVLGKRFYIENGDSPFSSIVAIQNINGSTSDDDGTVEVYSHRIRTLISQLINLLGTFFA